MGYLEELKDSITALFFKSILLVLLFGFGAGFFTAYLYLIF